MDRRQTKSKNAIISAFVCLLSQKHFDHITVGDIISLADVSRATFYAHFETKQDLLKILCEELFCHISDSLRLDSPNHNHIFSCNAPDSVFLHLFQHIKKNDNHILDLLKSSNNELFLQYFEVELVKLISTQLPHFESRKHEILPEEYWIEHISAIFTHTVRWWCKNGLTETPERITEYFYYAV